MIGALVLALLNQAPDRLAASISVSGGVQVAATSGQSGAAGGIGLHGELGGKLHPGGALVAALDGEVGFFPGGTASLFAFGPGLRIGSDVLFTIGGGGAIVDLSTASGATLDPMLFVHLTVPMVSYFGLHFGALLTFQSNAALAAVTVGVGAER